MNTWSKWIPVALIALVIGVAGLGLVTDFDGFDRHGRTGVGEVVTTSDGETLVIYDDDRDGFFPFGLLIFPLFWIVLIGVIFTFFRRGPWRGPDPPRPSSEAWLDDWHRRAHAEPTPHSNESGS